MSGSGLIYAAVLAAWAAYFVSRSVRSGGREVLVAPEGTVLRRRGATEAPAGSYALLRPQAGEPAEPIVKSRRVALAEALAPVPSPVRVQVGAATARRRRRALSSLAGLFLLVVLLAGAGLLPGWLPALPALLLGAYLIELRIQVRKAQLAAQPQPIAIPTIAARRHGVRRRRDGEESSWDPWPTFETKPGKVADLAEGWEPRPVPLPTYVTAAKAESVPGRRIDVASGRPWTANPFAETQELPDLRPAPAQESVVLEKQADEQEELEYDIPRAAGE
ncbi:MAG: hypothetical protein ACT4QF_24980 [Sporichthyaceae bacterium]